MPSTVAFHNIWMQKTFQPIFIYLVSELVISYLSSFSSPSVYAYPTFMNKFIPPGLLDKRWGPDMSFWIVVAYMISETLT